MKKKQILTITGVLLLTVFLAGPLSAGWHNKSAASFPTVPVDTVLTQWQFLHETPTLFDIFYRLVRCNGQHVVELKLLNENSKEQTVAFDIMVTGKDDAVLVKKSFKVTLQAGMMKEANCSEGLEPGFMFVIPGMEEPAQIKVKAVIQSQTH